MADAGNDGLVGVAKQAAEGDEGMEYIRLKTGDAAADVKKKYGARRQIYYARDCLICQSEGVTSHFLASVGVPHEWH